MLGFLRAGEEVHSRMEFGFIRQKIKLKSRHTRPLYKWGPRDSISELEPFRAVGLRIPVWPRPQVPVFWVGDRAGHSSSQDRSGGKREREVRAISFPMVKKTTKKAPKA